MKPNAPNGTKPEPVAGELFQIPYRDQQELESIVEGMMVGYATAINDSLQLRVNADKRFVDTLMDKVSAGRKKAAQTAKRAARGAGSSINAGRHWLGNLIKGGDNDIQLLQGQGLPLQRPVRTPHGRA